MEKNSDSKLKSHSLFLSYMYMGEVDVHPRRKPCVWNERDHARGVYL